MSPALQAIGVSRRFGGLLAVSDVSLDLHVGAVHAVIGPNGAGKSTLINLLTGELALSSGSLILEGRDASRWASWRFAQAGVARTFQRNNAFLEMSVLENARLAAQAVSVPFARLLKFVTDEDGPMQQAHAVLRRVGLNELAARPARTLSHGQLRLLEIALALAARPRVLLLDEPLAGLGAEETGPMVDLLRELRRDHAVLLVEHDMDVVFAVADTMTVMVDGRVLERGAPEHIRASAAVRDAYLGHSV